MAICFYEIPKKAVIEELLTETTSKLENEWKETTKGTVAKTFFLYIKEIKNKSKNDFFTAIVTGHDKRYLASTVSRWKTKQCASAMQENKQ